MKNNLNICGTIILYNPNESIFENIDSYITQLGTLIIVDNSEEVNHDLKKQAFTLFGEKLVYIENNENLGIATALNLACDRAIELGYDWILTMDQDSKFINFDNYIQCLTKFYSNPDIALLAPNPQWHAKELLPENPKCSFEEKFLVITSGNFLNLKLFNTIGRFEDKLFIDMVDHDYCLKANSLNYKIYYFKDIMLQHSLGSLFKRKNLITGKIRNKIEHNPQRHYYITRNFLYTWEKYSKQFPKEFNLLKTINILFIHEVTKILLYEDQKLKKIFAKFVGLFHFIMGRFGKYKL